MNRGYKFRIYPTTEQQVLFSKTFGCCRKIYNEMLFDKIQMYNVNGTFGSFTPAMYKEKLPYLKEVDSLALANVQLNLQSAFRNCFHSKHCKFPKFKSKHKSKNRYTTNNQKGSVRIIENTIKLPKIGFVKIKVHRKIPVGWKIKSVTISKENNEQYYASILYEFDTNIIQISKNTDKILGIDYKSDGLYMDSNGAIGTKHKYYRESQKKLAKVQRQLSRKRGSLKNETKSKNYLKQLKKVNKIHKHISNQRLDTLHKQSTKIANLYDVVCVENLNMKDMSNKGFGNGKATNDNGYGMFLNMLEYKMEDRGKYLIKIDKWFPSSQLCSSCGNQQKLTLKQRVYTCPKCGLVLDRDINAAINIKEEGAKLFFA